MKKRVRRRRYRKGDKVLGRVSREEFVDDWHAVCRAFLVGSEEEECEAGKPPVHGNLRTFTFGTNR
jgi:hypothetical protein